MNRQEAIRIIKNNWPNGRNMLSEALEFLIPELKESDDEKIKKWLIEGMKSLSEKSLFFGDIPKDKVVAWLEKQGKLVDEEKVLIDARKGIALSIMNFLDRNPLGMCLSNMECKDLEDAVVDSDWSKVYNYMKKKLEKQSGQKPAWSEEDVEMIDLLISILEINHPDAYFKSNDKDDVNMRAVPTKKIINWLKSLRERMKGE